MMNTEGGAVLAHETRRTQGDLRQPKGGGSTVGTAGVVPCAPSGGVAANNQPNVKGTDAGKSAHAPLKTVQVSKRVLHLYKYLREGNKRVRIEGLADLTRWRGKVIPASAQFLATDWYSGTGLAFLSLAEKEQLDLLLEEERQKAGNPGALGTMRPTGKGVAA